MSTELSRQVTHADLPSTQVSEAITQALEGLKAIRTFIQAEFREGIDFGTIPGCGDKPTLFLPGAQKAMMYFNARPRRTIERIDLGGGHVEFLITTRIVSRATGLFLGEGVGCCSTMEGKYRYRKAERVCPSCGRPTIINGKEEYGGGYLCFARKGGCGARFGKGNKAIESQKQGVVENTELYDVHNTVLKIGKKRADVDAAMTLGCLSELFTQDIEDTFPMVEVREAARPGEPEPDHVDGEIVEGPAPRASGRNTHPNQSGFASGQYATQEQADYLKAMLDEKLVAVNSQWLDFWQDPRSGALPPPIRREFMNVHQLDNHLVKWAIDSGRLDESSRGQEDGQVRQLCRYSAIVLYRSRADGRALKAEIDDYLAKQWDLKRDAVYRKHPELAPVGYAEEQAEAHGDAHEGDMDGAAAAANGLGENG